MSQERTRDGVTTDLHSDRLGFWYVWCDSCERYLGDAVPFDMAKEKQEKRRQHEAAHARREAS